MPWRVVVVIAEEIRGLHRALCSIDVSVDLFDDVDPSALARVVAEPGRLFGVDARLVGSSR
jgi:hypothetical protein